MTTEDRFGHYRRLEINAIQLIYLFLINSLCYYISTYFFYLHTLQTKKKTSIYYIKGFLGCINKLLVKLVYVQYYLN